MHNVSICPQVVLFPRKINGRKIPDIVTKNKKKSPPSWNSSKI